MSSNSQTSAAEEEAKSLLVPKLRFPEFRDEKGWGERPLSEFMSESRLPGSKGNVAKKITVKLWGNGVFEKNDAIQGSINTQYFRRNAGQFIYSKLDFLNQAFGIVPPSLDGFESTVDLPCFDFADGLIPAFLLEYVKQRDFYERLGETADGSRKARRIHAETFLSFPIALPSPTEQQKIAECLSSVDELMAAQARKVDALKTHKKGLMQQLFPRDDETQPRLRFPEFQNAGEWEPDTLENVCAAKISYGIVQAGPHVPNGMPYIKSTDLNSELCLANLARTSEAIAQKYRRSEVVPGDIVFSLRGNIGVAQILPEGIPVANLTQGTARIRTKGPPEFYFHALRSPSVNGRIQAVGKGSTFQEISLDALRNIRLFHPKPAEQQRIASCLSSLDALITAETQKHEALKTHKKGLIQQLFPSLEEVDP
jgi:type I restriction enzyme S subunit